MIESLSQAYLSCPIRDQVAIIGSVPGGPRPKRHRCATDNWTEEKTVITSGSLIRLDVFAHLGPFPEEFFIDYIDHEYCLRVRRGGFRVIRCCLPTIRHEIGQPRRHRLLWRPVTPTHHASARRYYITRNRIVVWRRYARSEPGFVLADMSAAARELVKIALFEADRWNKARAVAWGVLDGLRERLGPAPPELFQRSPSAAAP